MTAGLARVVFDTNILVSAHFWKGPPYRCLLAIEAGLAILVVCESILSELGEKLITKFAVPQSRDRLDRGAAPRLRRAHANRGEIRLSRRFRFQRGVTDTT